MFERKRWTGQEGSTRAFGLFERINRVFSRTYARFAAKVGRPTERLAEPVLGVAALVDGPGVDLDASVAERNAPEDPLLGPAGGVGGIWEAQRREQSKHRDTACNWISGCGPLADLTNSGVVVEIMRKHTAKMLYVAGEEWAAKQQTQAREAQADCFVSSL